MPPDTLASSLDVAYFRQTAVFFLVYDVSRRETFDSLEWFAWRIGREAPKTTLVAVVGHVRRPATLSTSDEQQQMMGSGSLDAVTLPREREVTIEEAEAWASEKNYAYFEITSGSAESVYALLYVTAGAVLDQLEHQEVLAGTAAVQFVQRSGIRVIEQHPPPAPSPKRGGFLGCC